MAAKIESFSFGNYQVLTGPDGAPELLGGGAYGKTYRAVHRFLDGEVALKVIHDSFAYDDEVKRRFLAEARAIAKLQHPNIAQIKDFGDEDGTLYYAMEYCDGGDLEQYVRGAGAMADEPILQFGLQAAQALAYVHSQGFLHRDLKPSNLMLVKVGQEFKLKIIDFGLVKNLDQEHGHNLTTTGQFLGTLVYASPEQLREDALGPASDVFSLGLTLWFLAHGGLPFTGKPAQIVAQRLAVESYEALLPTDIGTPLRSLLADMLRLDPARRISSMDAVVERIEDGLAGGSSDHKQGTVLIPPAKSRPTASATPATARTTLGLTNVDHVLASSFQIHGETGKTALGIRFRASDLRSSQSVALTMLHRRLSANTTLLEQLELTAAKAAAYEGPYLVKPLSLTRFRDQVVLVEEWVGGLSLLSLLKHRGQLALPEAAQVLRQLAEALDRAQVIGLGSVNLVGQEIWFQLGKTEAGTFGVAQSRTLLDQKLTNWPTFVVRITPSYETDERVFSQGGGSLSTVSGLRTGVTDFHTVLPGAEHQTDYLGRFTRLIYRILSGRPAPAVAGLSRNAYINISGLSEPGNKLLADAMSGEAMLADCLALLQELCDVEAVTLPELKLPSPGRGLEDIEISSDPFAAGRMSEGAPAIAQVMPGRLGVLLSPFTGLEVSVLPWQWIAGAELVCPVTSRTFCVPDGLPQWIPEATIIADSPGKILDPFSEQPAVLTISGELWEGGRLLEVNNRQVRLPAQVPDLVADEQGIEFCRVVTPYAKGRVVEISELEWAAGARVRCPLTGRYFLLPSKLPEPPVLEGTAADSEGYVRSPYGSKPRVSVDPDSWVAGHVVVCPQSGRNFTLPKTLPLLFGLIDENRPFWALPPFGSADWVEISPEFWRPQNEIRLGGRSFLLPVHLPAPCFVGELVPGRPGRVLSPYRPGVEVAVAPLKWLSGERLLCPATQFSFLLPNNLPLLQGTVVRDRPCWVRSPFDDKSEFEVPIDQWLAGEEITCPKTQRPFVLPADLPEARPQAKLTDEVYVVLSPFGAKNRQKVDEDEWVPGGKLECKESGRPFWLPGILTWPVAEVDSESVFRVKPPFRGATWLDLAPADWRAGNELDWKGRRYVLPDRLAVPAKVASLVPHRPAGWIFSPYKPQLEVEVPPMLWQSGAKVACPETGFSCIIPSPLPLLVGALVKGRACAVRSPFPPGVEVDVPPADWVPSAEIVCPRTLRVFRLPSDIEEVRLTGILTNLPGSVQSPFAGRPVIKIPPDDWVAGYDVICPESGRVFFLPDNLPPLEGLVDAKRLFEVKPPFTKAGWMSVDPADWKSGEKLKWKDKIFVLPPELAEANKEGAAIASKPGMVTSPYRDGLEVAVPAGKWLPGEKIICPATGQPFRLPAKLPSLVGTPVTGKSFTVTSPYDATCQLVVPATKWRPREEVVCPRTGRSFVLPESLPDPQEPAILGSVAGRVESPYATAVQLEVAPADWRGGGLLNCPVTGWPILLPADLPPLFGIPVPGRPGILLSPYDRTIQITVPKAKWKPHSVVRCPGSRQSVEVPEEIEPYGVTTTSGKRTLIVGLVGAGVLFAAVGVGVYFYKPDFGDGQVGDQLRYSQLTEALKTSTTPLDNPDGTASLKEWDELWAKRFAEESNPTAKLLLWENRKELLSLAKVWTADEFHEAFGSLMKLGKNQEASAWLQDAKASSDVPMKEMAWGLALDQAEASGPKPAADEAWQALKSGVQIARAKTLLTRDVSAIDPSVLDEVFKGNHSIFSEQELQPLAVAAANSPDNKVKAVALLLTARTMEAKGMSPTDATLRVAYLKAAQSGSEEAIRWLQEKIVAVPNGAMSLIGAGQPTQGLVANPFGASLPPVSIPAIAWRPAAKLTVKGSDGDLYFSLPAKDLPILRAVADMNLCRKPTGSSMGSVRNPFVQFGANASIPLSAKEWIPGIELEVPDMPQCHIVLPDPDVFDFLVATIDMAKVKAAKAGIVTSPVTGREVKIPWVQWKPGSQIEENVDGLGVRPAFVLNKAVSDESMDPELLAGDPQFDGERFSIGMGKYPERSPQIQNPYFPGEKLIVDVKSWKPGAKIPVKNAELEAAKVRLTVTLPATLPPIPAYPKTKSGDENVSDMHVPGVFVYWNAVPPPGEWKEFSTKGDAKLSMESFGGVVEVQGQQFEISAKLWVREVGGEPIDPISGVSIPLPSWRKMVAATEGDTKTPRGVSFAVSDDARSLAIERPTEPPKPEKPVEEERKPVRQTMPPGETKGDREKELAQKAAEADQRRAKQAERDAEAKRIADAKNKPTAPPTPEKPLRSTGNAPPEGYRARVKGGGHLSQFMFNWTGNGWRSDRPLLEYGGDAQKDAEASLLKTSGNFPKRSSVQIQGGYIYVIP